MYRSDSLGGGRSKSLGRDHHHDRCGIGVGWLCHNVDGGVGETREGSLTSQSVEMKERNEWSGSPASIRKA
jgi:hypothetical protein